MNQVDPVPVPRAGATETVPAALQASILGADDPDRFINRELSWLDFNHRVLEEAENPHHPVLERLRFVSISAANLDEFWSVRVAGLIGQAKAGVSALSPDGRTPAQQLHEVAARAERLMAEQCRVWVHLRGLLAKDGIELCEPATLRDEDRQWLEAWFMERVFPVLTPARRRSGASVSVHSQYGPGDGAGPGARGGRAPDARR